MSGRGRTLRTSREFRRVLREGTAFRSPLVLLYVAPSDGPSRAGFVAGRRIGSAVARNRARRLLREAWRDVGPRVQAAVELVLVAQPDIEGAKAPDVMRDLNAVLTRAGLISA